MEGLPDRKVTHSIGDSDSTPSEGPRADEHGGPFCDTQCCNIFTPLKTYAHCYEGVEKSPYQAVVDGEICQGHRDCIARCRFEAIGVKKDEATGTTRTCCRCCAASTGA